MSHSVWTAPPLEITMQTVPVPARLVITWLALLPLVLFAQFAVRGVTDGWPWPLVTALVMTLVVPLASLLAIPALTRAYVRYIRAPRGGGAGR